MNAYERVSSFLDYDLIAKKLGVVQPVGAIKTNNELVVKTLISSIVHPKRSLKTLILHYP